MTTDYRYLVFCSRGDYGFAYTYTSSDPYEKPDTRDVDQMLHRALSHILYHHCFDSVRKLVGSPKRLFELVVEQEPALGKILVKRQELSLLWIAVLCCYHKSAELLVRSGADVNVLYDMDVKIHYDGQEDEQDIYKESTLIHALLQMYPSAWNELLIGLLIEYGADIDAQDSEGFTALHMAARHGRVKVAKMLLEKGADVNAVCLGEMTPLLEAALNSRAQDEMIPLLMRHGADITARCESGMNVLRYLAMAPGEHVELAKILIEKGVSPRELPDSDQFQPIHAAVERGHTNLVNLYLDHGANVNAQVRDNTFPLFIAALEVGNSAMLRTLLKRGANVDLRNDFGETALHGLVKNYRFGLDTKNTVEWVKILLDAGADMFAEANNGEMPFDVVLFEHGKEYLRIFLKKLRTARLQPSTEFKEERIIEERYPEVWEYYQDFVEEINLIKCTRFVETCTFFDLLTKCQCQIARLMRHRGFGSKFWLWLEYFPMYVEDIVEAFERAERYYRSMMDHENLIDDATQNRLPYMVVRNISRLANNCKICGKS